jgi:predicted nucleotidyltransferase
MPETSRRDLQRVVDILKRHGAKKIILYGSYARGTATPASDIDLCEEGIPSADYFRAWAECLMTISSHVSILDLISVQGYLRERILREGEVIYAAG